MRDAVRGKHVLITGGANGIGYAIGALMVKNGARVTALDRVKPSSALAGVEYRLTDVTSVRALARVAQTLHAPIDVLINNAGVMRRGTILTATEDDWNLLVGVNLKAQWLVLRAFWPHLAPRATLAFIASQHGMNLPEDPGLYALTKAGVIALARLVQNTAPKHRVKLICPGPVDTALHQHGRAPAFIERERQRGVVCTPDDIARHILRLLNSFSAMLCYDRDSCRYRFKKNLPCS